MGNDVLASPLRRLLANLVDLLFLVVALAPGFATMIDDPRRGETLMNIGLVGTAVLQWSLVCQTGQSFGKRLLGLKIVRTNGQPVDKVSGVALRTYWVLALLQWKYGFVLCLVDVLPVFGPKRQCIHDMTAGTKVIRWDAAR